MTTKISCGGFDIDNNTLIEEDGVLKVKGGGGGGSVLVVQKQANALDYTWQEIHDAMLTGGVVVLIPDTEEVNSVTAAGYLPKRNLYVVEIADLGYQIYRYVTPTADGHPVEDSE